MHLKFSPAKFNCIIFKNSVRYLKFNSHQNNCKVDIYFPINTYIRDMAAYLLMFLYLWMVYRHFFQYKMVARFWNRAIGRIPLQNWPFDRNCFILVLRFQMYLDNLVLFSNDKVWLLYLVLMLFRSENFKGIGFILMKKTFIE